MTTRVIQANNLNTALEDALWWLKTAGVVNDSRNGRVVQAPGPVITVYRRPTQRVMFSALRDANPFFHLYESLWMLAGREDVESVAWFAPRMREFSEDGEHLEGAYGQRWREAFGFDQLRELILLLTTQPKTRRAVLTMWAPFKDLHAATPDSKDVPCNTQVYFDLTRGVLDMTVCNRSNDAVWGCYGANAVHMSMLQEFVALAVGVPVGLYYQFSNNLHMYLDRPDCQRLLYTPRGGYNTAWHVVYEGDDRYTDLHPPPLFTHTSEWEGWLEDCEAVAQFPTGEHYGRHPYFREVVVPLMTAYACYKDAALEDAVAAAKECRAPDWRTAAVEWLERRLQKRNRGAE